MDKYDFSGWATRNNLKCSDGRIIMPDAFKDNSGEVVPLVWNHRHDQSTNVLGHALLENRPDGVYAYCTLNDTESGKNTKLLVDHGDLTQLSIYANHLRQQGNNVIHGAIKEVSLVLAGANPGAFIDSVIRHGENEVESEDEAVIYSGEDFVLFHADDQKSQTSNNSEVKMEDKAATPKEQNNTESQETIRDVFNTLTDKQKTVVYALIYEATADHEMEDDQEDMKEDAYEMAQSEEGDKIMKNNVFEQNEQTTSREEVLSHSDMVDIIKDAKQFGSLKESVLQHGITNVDYLFPDAKTLNTPPGLITRSQGWVNTVMNGVHHTPFSRIRSMFANLTAADARAKGYTKGKYKLEEVFGLLKRTTTPTTVYKKQRMDRDDVVDITDFDVVAWLKSEMRMMLDEEIARSVLVGDGRLSSSDDKINEQNIRPIWTDEDLYSIKATISIASSATDSEKAKAFIQKSIKSRKEYKGTGEPTLFTTDDILADCLLMEDTTGRVIYESVDKLKSAMRVKDIITVPVMESLTRTNADGDTATLMGIIVNLNDYNVGADKGGSVSMFDDFDIDYNQQKYLIETRCSGALTVPYSAIVLESVVA